MKFSLHIDQVRSLEWGLTASQAILFDWLYSVPSWAEHCVLRNEIWYFASRTKACQDVSICSDKPDTIYRHYKTFEEKGLINLIKFDRKDYIQITQKGKQWFFGKKSEYSEINPNNLGNKSELNSEINPIYYNININKNINDNNYVQSEIEIYPTFEQWYDLYQRKDGKEPARKEWGKLKPKEKEQCMVHTPEYCRGVKKEYLLKANNYLKDKAFNDEIIKQRSESISQTADQIARFEQRWQQESGGNSHQ